MAKIALVTESISHVAYTNTASLLQSHGHVVTGYEMATVTHANLIGNDLICTVRTPPNAVLNDKIAAAGQAGKPVLCGTDSGGLNGVVSITAPAVRCGLIKSQVTTNPLNSGYAQVASSIFSAASVPAPGPFTLYSGANSAVWFADKVPREIDVMAKFALPIAQDAASGTGDLIVQAAAGTRRLSSGLNGPGIFEAPIAFCGFFYGVDGYSAEAGRIIKALVNWLLAGGPGSKIDGSVRDASGAGVARTVRAFSRDTGKLLAVTTSDSSTGKYLLRALGSPDVATVVCLDAADGSKNALVKDRVAWTTE